MERNTRSPSGGPQAQPSSPPLSDRPKQTDRPDVNLSSPMTGQGKLVFQITTAGGAIPLEGAEIILREFRSKSDGNGGDVVAVLYSGADGKTEVLTLPAPARSLSLEPARDGAPVPYALYNADVNLDNYYTQSYIRIPVFDGITSIQRASLIPLPENGYSQGLRPDSEKFYEGESPDL